MKKLGANLKIKFDYNIKESISLKRGTCSKKYNKETDLKKKDILEKKIKECDEYINEYYLNNGELLFNYYNDDFKTNDPEMLLVDDFFLLPFFLFFVFLFPPDLISFASIITLSLTRFTQSGVSTK